MPTLNIEKTIYEINQNTKVYRDKTTQRTQQTEFGKFVYDNYGFGEDFVFMSSTQFGLLVGSPSEKKYDKELRKNPIHGLRQFKKASPIYKEISEKAKTILMLNYDRFLEADAFGIGNRVQHQWVGERWFATVTGPSEVGVELDIVKPEEYLAAVRGFLAEDEVTEVCQECGGELEDKKEALMSMPPLFLYVCKACGARHYKQTDGKFIERKGV